MKKGRVVFRNLILFLAAGVVCGLLSMTLVYMLPVNEESENIRESMDVQVALGEGMWAEEIITPGYNEIRKINLGIGAEAGDKGEFRIEIYSEEGLIYQKNIPVAGALGIDLGRRGLGRTDDIGFYLLVVLWQKRMCKLFFEQCRYFAASVF